MMTLEFYQRLPMTMCHVHKILSPKAPQYLSGLSLRMEKGLALLSKRTGWDATDFPNGVPLSQPGPAAVDLIQRKMPAGDLWGYTLACGTLLSSHFVFCYCIKTSRYALQTTEPVQPEELNKRFIDFFKSLVPQNREKFIEYLLDENNFDN
jgi:hypothetical protein